MSIKWRSSMCLPRWLTGSAGQKMPTWQELCCSVHGSCFRTAKDDNHLGSWTSVIHLYVNGCLAEIGKWTIWRATFFGTDPHTCRPWHTTYQQSLSFHKIESTWIKDVMPILAARTSRLDKPTLCATYGGNTMSKNATFAWPLEILYSLCLSKKTIFCWEDKSSDQWPTVCWLVYHIILSFLPQFYADIFFTTLALRTGYSLLWALFASTAVGLGMCLGRESFGGPKFGFFQHRLVCLKMTTVGGLEHFFMVNR